MGVGQTNVVDYNSPLVRKDWVKNNLGSLAQDQFFAPYVGGSENSMIHQVESEKSDAGHTVVFQTNGSLQGNFVKGDETLIGTGEQQLVFEDKIVVEEYRTAVNLGTRYDAQEINNLESNMHSYAITELSKLWNKAKDQMIFDSMQQGATDRLVFNDFNYDTIAYINQAVSTGYGYVGIDNKDTKRKQRLPLVPFNGVNYGGSSEPLYILFVDQSVTTAFLTNTETKNLMSSSDVRGRDNMLLRGVIGRIGNILVVNAPSFFGYSSNNFFDKTRRYPNITETKIQFAGLRNYVGSDDTYTPLGWSGTADFKKNATKGNKLYSRCILAGASAIQFGAGRSPEYTLEEFDHKHKAESGLSVICNAKPTILKSSNAEADYNVGITDNSFGMIAIDIKLPDMISQSVFGK